MTPQEWFDQFQTALALDDPEQEHACFINMNRPEDRNRIYVLGNNSLEHILPENGPITDAHKEQLFNLANEGKLFVYPLCSTTPLQADVKDGQTLNVLEFNAFSREYDKDVEEPEPVKFGILKRILNSVFGFFKEDKQRYDTYQEQLREFNRDCKVLDYVDFIRANGSFIFGREKDMRNNNEFWRRQSNAELENAENQLADKNLTPWKKDFFEAKAKVVRGIIDGNSKFFGEEAKEMLVSLAVDALVTKQPQLGELFLKEPSQMQDMRRIFGASKFIQQLLHSNDMAQGGLVTSCILGDKISGDLLIQYSAEIRDRQTVAGMLEKENAIDPVGNDMAGVKELFFNEKINSLYHQLDHARNRIPKSEREIWVHNDTLGKKLNYTDVNDIKLNDPRVLKIVEADKANGAQPNKNMEIMNNMG